MVGKEKIKLASDEILRLKQEERKSIFRPNLPDPIFYEAPCVLLVCVEKPKGEFVEMDVSLCVQNCILQAEEEGLSTCIIGYARYLERVPGTKSRLGIPESWEVVLGFCLGERGAEPAQSSRESPKILFG